MSEFIVFGIVVFVLGFILGFKAANGFNAISILWIGRRLTKISGKFPEFETEWYNPKTGQSSKFLPEITGLNDNDGCFQRIVIKEQNATEKKSNSN